MSITFTIRILNGLSEYLNYIENSLTSLADEIVLVRLAVQV